MEPTQDNRAIQADNAATPTRENDGGEHTSLLHGIRNLATITLCQRTEPEQTETLPLLLGTYTCNVDNKGRLIIPKAHVKILGSEKSLLAIADPSSGSIFLFPKTAFFEMIPAALHPSSDHNTHLEQVRISLQNAREIHIDTHNRIQLNPLLRSLEKNECSTCLVMGSGNFLEIKPQNQP
jgi:DNA-binding transcriptional regulator/RsmH inhibitor MraZ